MAWGSGTVSINKESSGGVLINFPISFNTVHKAIVNGATDYKVFFLSAANSSLTQIPLKGWNLGSSNHSNMLVCYIAIGY